MRRDLSHVCVKLSHVLFTFALVK